VFAGLRYVAIEHKKGQQRSHAVRVNRRDQMLPERKARSFPSSSIRIGVTADFYTRWEGAHNRYGL
jgi:hypothetical protein